MPLRCVDRDGIAVHAFDLSADEWALLQQHNRRNRHLRMPCCNATVTLRRSRRGTQFFAHKATGVCVTQPETEAHLRLKALAVAVARKCGWTATTEVSGRTPAGEYWRADVLAVKGKHRVAVEIQWSSQTFEETLRRQKQYDQCGVRGLWLLRHAGFPITSALPAAKIKGSIEAGFVASLPQSVGEQAVKLEDLLEAAFTRRLRYGLPVGTRANASISAGHMFCWACGAETEIIASVCLRAGPHTIEFSVSDFTEHPSLQRTLVENLPARLGRSLKKRRSEGAGRTYWSNGCEHCGALIGDFYEYEAHTDQRPICEFEATIDQAWLNLVNEQDDPSEAWGVFTE